MQEDVPVDARDPTAARPPVIVPRHRPAPVVLSSVLLVAEAALGLIAAIALLVAAADVPATFRSQAALSVDGVSPADLDGIAGTIRALLLVAAVLTLLLAIASVLLAAPVAPARASAYRCLRPRRGRGLRSAGRHLVHRVRAAHRRAGGVTHPSEGVTAAVGQVYGEAMPGWLVGATGGLTDLRALGYIAVAVFLALPVAQPYFRRRTAAPAPVIEPDTEAEPPPD